MLKIKLKTVFLVLIFCSAFFTELKAGHADTSDLTEAYDPKPMIMHHVLNAHEWHLFDYKDNEGKSHPVSIPLPIILFTEGNLDIFLSSDFKHGQVAVKKGNRTYTLDEHGHIEEVNGASILDISITKNVASMLISVLLILFLLMSTANGYKRNKYAPKKIQAFLEPLILFVRDDIIKANIGPKHERYTSFLLTVFFFILINNLLFVISY